MVPLQWDIEISGAQAARLAGVPAGTLRMWNMRGHVDPADVVTLHGALRLAIANKLIGIGVHPRDAWVATAKYFVSKGAAGWSADGDAKILRGAGELFPNGVTALLVHSGGEASVVNAKSANEIPVVRRKDVLPPTEPVIVLILNGIVHDFEAAAKRDLGDVFE